MKGISNTINRIKTDITNISLQMLYGKNLNETFEEIKKRCDIKNEAKGE